MPNTVPAAGEAMPINHSLTAAILRYRGETNLFNAECLEASERGEDDNRPYPHWGSIKTIEGWTAPANHIQEAILALSLAIEDYEMGPTDRIPAMLNAVIGWMKAEAKRRMQE